LDGNISQWNPLNFFWKCSLTIAEGSVYHGTKQIDFILPVRSSRSVEGCVRTVISPVMNLPAWTAGGCPKKKGRVHSSDELR
jgi:hypothetical protein